MSMYLSPSRPMVLMRTREGTSSLRTPATLSGPRMRASYSSSRRIQTRICVFLGSSERMILSIVPTSTPSSWTGLLRFRPDTEPSSV